MKHILSIMLFLICPSTYAETTADIIQWGFGGVNRSREWVSPDGRMNHQNQLQESAAIDFWGASNLPTSNSISEITLHRNTWGLGYDERFNVSAMTGGIENGAYRFGVERAGTGQFRDIIFCFEDVTPGVPACMFKITQDGVFIKDSGVWKRVATQ